MDLEQRYDHGSRWCCLALVDGVGVGREDLHSDGGDVILNHISFSQSLGTSLGDWIADSGGLSFEGRRVRVPDCALLLDQHLARYPARGGLHSDAAARRHRGLSA